MADARQTAIARRLADARRAGARIVLDDRPHDIADAFTIQHEVVAQLGEPTIGWKVNELPDGAVTFAPLLASGQVPARGTWAVTGAEPAGIELEIAFRMGADVPAHATRDETLAAVASAHVVFELCQSRLSDPDTVPRHVALADAISNAGLVVGDVIPDWRSRDLRAVPGRLFVDGREHKAGRSADPFRALEVLPRGLAAQGRQLRAGHVVITGSLIGMNWFTGRHAIHGEIDGCGTVEALVIAR